MKINKTESEESDSDGASESNMADHGIGTSNFELLTDSNYFLWSSRVKNLMCAKNLWISAVVNDEPLRPDHGDQDHETLLKTWEKWERNNAKVKMPIFNNMSAP